LSALVTPLSSGHSVSCHCCCLSVIMSHSVPLSRVEVRCCIIGICVVHWGAIEVIKHQIHVFLLLCLQMVLNCLISMHFNLNVRVCLSWERSWFVEVRFIIAVAIVRVGLLLRVLSGDASPCSVVLGLPQLLVLTHVESLARLVRGFCRTCAAICSTLIGCSVRVIIVVVVVIPVLTTVHLEVALLLLWVIKVAWSGWELLVVPVFLSSLSAVAPLVVVASGSWLLERVVDCIVAVYTARHSSPCETALLIETVFEFRTVLRH
jgi:hypothetical protein